MNSVCPVQEFRQQGRIYIPLERSEGRVAVVSDSIPHLSPSLLRPSRTAASYEIKFLLQREQAERVERWAQHHLSLDPHADAALGNAYHIQSLYFDTDQFDVYHQQPAYRRRTFRLRRYGSETDTYLERKTKYRGRVSKYRTRVSETELERLAAREEDETWAGHWFHRRLLARQLKPRCLVHYERVAFIGRCEGEPIRLTLDRNIRCSPVERMRFETPCPGVALLTEEVILELKYRSVLPVLFKRLLQEERLNPSGVSKYRHGVEAWRLASNVRGGADTSMAH